MTPATAAPACGLARQPPQIRQRDPRERPRHPRDAPFDVFVWDREAQARSDVDTTVEALYEQGAPVFVVGGRYTFQCFMPWVDRFFITRTALTLDGPPLYMPDLFGTTQ